MMGTTDLDVVSEEDYIGNMQIITINTNIIKVI